MGWVEAVKADTHRKQTFDGYRCAQPVYALRATRCGRGAAGGFKFTSPLADKPSIASPEMHDAAGAPEQSNGTVGQPTSTIRICSVRISTAIKTGQSRVSRLYPHYSRGPSVAAACPPRRAP